MLNIVNRTYAHMHFYACMLTWFVCVAGKEGHWKFQGGWTSQAQEVNATYMREFTAAMALSVFAVCMHACMYVFMYIRRDSALFVGLPYMRLRALACVQSVCPTSPNPEPFA